MSLQTRMQLVVLGFLPMMASGCPQKAQPNKKPAVKKTTSKKKQGKTVVKQNKKTTIKKLNQAVKKPKLTPSEKADFALQMLKDEIKSAKSQLRISKKSPGYKPIKKHVYDSFDAALDAYSQLKTKTPAEKKFAKKITTQITKSFKNAYYDDGFGGSNNKEQVMTYKEQNKLIKKFQKLGIPTGIHP